MKPARKVVARRRKVTRPLTLSQRVERLERDLLFKQPAPIGNTAARFVNLGSDGKPTAGDHVAVLQPSTGLIWTAAPINDGKEMNHADATSSAEALDLLGQKIWRLPTIVELLSIVDYERWNPAVDPAHFKGPYSWTWSATTVKGEGAPSGYARFVDLGYGNSGWSNQDFRYQALAVRASQQGLLAFGK